MPVTGQGIRIELPTLEDRPWGMFIDVVPELSLVDSKGVNRAAFGAKFLAEGDLTPQLIDFNCGVADDLDTGNIVYTELEQIAFSAWNLISCSAISEDPEILRARLKNNARAVESEILAQGVTTQITATHLNLLDDSALLSASVGIQTAVSKVESALADRMSNKRGYIFVPIVLLAQAFTSGAVKLVNGVLVSAAGHLVISDAGHGSDTTVFGTGEMGQYISPVMNPEGGELEIDRDIVTLWAQRYAIVVFNPAHSVRTVVS